jgi:hypothetical protein
MWHDTVERRAETRIKARAPATGGGAGEITMVKGRYRWLTTFLPKILTSALHSLKMQSRS